MDRSIGNYVATAVAAVAIAVVVLAAFACFRQAAGLLLLTEDVSWLLFETT